MTHALQTAHFARAAGADDELILAAALHDVGRLPSIARRARTSLHEYVGGAFVAEAISPRAGRIVAAHVRAKRYLVALEPGYRDVLSDASRACLDAQGGALDPAGTPSSACRGRRTPSRCAAGTMRRRFRTVRRWRSTTCWRSTRAFVAAPELIVRPARWTDRDAILRLTLAMGGHDDVARRDDPMRRLGAALGRADTRVVVAERDGAIVGFAEVQARVSMVTDRFEAWLGALAVAPQARRGGVGAALLAAVEREARLLGCDAIVLESSAWRDDAYAFYRRSGFDERAPAVRFARTLSSDDDAALLQRFLDAAARAANAVAAAIAGLRDEASVGQGADGAPTEAADAAAEDAALRAFAALPCAIVSEERGLIGAPPGPGDCWIALDPLDGSRNYRAGYPPYAMAAGLVRDGVAIAGYVADLTSGRRWWAAGGAAYVDGRPAHTRRSPIAVVPSPSSGAPPARIAIPGVTRIRASGSTAIDLCRVADGSAAAFVALDRAVAHAHDLAGAMAVIVAAGGCVLEDGGRVPVLAPDAAALHRIVAAADRELAEALTTAPGG